MSDERSRLGAYLGLLESNGYLARLKNLPHLVVFNTCAVRENASNRLYGHLGNLKATKDEHPGMQIAVGGCLAQKDQNRIVERAPWVDVVFGTHNIGSLPVLLNRSLHNDEAQVELLEAWKHSPPRCQQSVSRVIPDGSSISVG